MTPGFARTMLAGGLIAAVVAAQKAPPIYDEGQDAAADIEKALKEASASKRHVLLDFGANW